MSSTLCALSSVARLSVSMTMLMSSGAHRKRLYVDGLVGSTSSAGPSASQAGCSKRHAVDGDDDQTGSGPTPPPAQHNKASYHRHLWKLNAKRAAAASSSTGSRGMPPRGGRLPARIESLPNMTLTSTPESAASARRKVYGSGGRRRPQTNSFSGTRGQRNRSGASPSASNDAMTTEESSTSCGEDSSDGPVFDIIREESIKRPSGRCAVQQDADADGHAVSTATAIHSTPRSSPVNNSGVSIVIDNNELSSETAVLPIEASTPLLDTSSSNKQQLQQQQVDDRTSVCQQSGSKTFLLSEMT